jgi:uncharacterized cupredoxin-like copper-binding protein
MMLSAIPFAGVSAQSSEPTASPRVVRLVISNGVITPDLVPVHRGETLTFEVQNAGPTDVEFMIGLRDELAVDAGDSIREAERIGPGESATLTYTFDTDGPYAFGDHVGHEVSQGVRGSIHVAGEARSDIAIATAPTVVPRVVLLVITEDAIVPPEIQIEPGESVTFVGYNATTSDVELIVGLEAEVAADAGDSLKEAEHMAPGESATLSYHFDGPGPWGYGDQMSDHYERGVGGDIVVRP